MTNYTHSIATYTGWLHIAVEAGTEMLAGVDNYRVPGRQKDRWQKLRLYRLPRGGYLLLAEQIQQGEAGSAGIKACADAQTVLRALEELDEAFPGLAKKLLQEAAKKDAAFKG